MNKKTLEPWLIEGHKLFAIEGPNNLNIEHLSRLLNKNKSSFYHHFGDLDVYTELLFEYHIEQVKKFCIEIDNSKDMIPGLIDVLVDYKQVVFFNRELRINIQMCDYIDCYEKSRNLLERSIFTRWKSFMGLDSTPKAAALLLRVISDNMHLKATFETFNHDWLLSFSKEIIQMTSEIKTSGEMNGSV